MLSLVEHFFSIQGEGRRVGKPSLFFRFGGCNMRCVGFGCKEIAPTSEQIVGCDTLYAVHNAFSSQWQEIKSIDTLIKIKDSYKLDSRYDIVLTGGEPLLHANNPLFVEFVEYLIHQNHHITFETNGAIDIDFTKYPIYKEASYALSIKLSNSAEPESKRIKADTIRSIAKKSKDSFFKFTIDKNSANLVQEIKKIASLAPDLEVFCMPLGESAEMINEHCHNTIELCKKEGYTYSDRLHIRIWDANRGV